MFWIFVIMNQPFLGRKARQLACNAASRSSERAILGCGPKFCVNDLSKKPTWPFLHVVPLKTFANDDLPTILRTISDHDGANFRILN